MFKNKIVNNNKISVPFFIFASFFALFFMIFIIAYLGTKVKNGPSHQVPFSGGDSNEIYYLNEDFKQNDPFITRNPNLKTMLRGPIITALDPSIGNKNAKVNLVYFSDFKCDYCYKQESVLKEVQEKYKDDVRVIWKDYPDGGFNSVSFQASLAARCAQDQNKFWEYHELLFDNNENLSQNLFINLAEELDLDTDYFEACLEEGHGSTRVRDNILEANALEITGIPFMYVNSQEIMGEINLEDLEKIIEIELNK